MFLDSLSDGWGELLVRRMLAKRELMLINFPCCKNFRSFHTMDFVGLLEAELNKTDFIDRGLKLLKNKGILNYKKKPNKEILKTSLNKIEQ